MLSFQPQKWTGKAVSPACPEGQEGTGSPSPWQWPAHGEVGQKIPRISAQARPDIPFQCKRCQCWAGDVLPAARGAQGGWHCSTWGPEQQTAGKATDLEVNIPSHDLASEVQAFNFDPHSTLCPCMFPGAPGTVTGCVQCQGNRAVVSTSSSSASRQSCPLKLQPPLGSIKQLLSLDRT